MKINGQMVVLARELRDLTQDELARKIFTSQATIARIEVESDVAVPDARAEQLAAALDVPIKFLQQKEDLIGVGSSAYFYRKKASLSAADMRRIHSIVNLLRIHLKKMLTAVEIVPKRKLPILPVAEYGSSTNAAHVLRQCWSLPDGPIRNLTHLVESSGALVLSCDFQTNNMDATSIRLAEMPPIIFMNKNVPGDRWRFTLAHELAHLVLHEVPCEQMEDEADEFASEFLLPSIEMKALFSRMPKIRLQDLANQKPFWKVSVAALIERAWHMGEISDSSRRYLWASLKKHGYPNEPYPIERESPVNQKNVIGYFLEKLQFSAQGLADYLCITRQDLEFLHGPAYEKISPRKLALVR